METRSTCAFGLAVAVRYARVASSTGKKPAVAPYSGDMFPMVALSGTESWPNPSPKYSTKAPTTFFSLSLSVTVRTRSVGVTPSLRVPVRFTPKTFGIGMW